MGLHSLSSVPTLPEQQEWRIDSHNRGRLWSPFPKSPAAQYPSLPLELHHGETAFAHRNKMGTQRDSHVSSSLRPLHHSSFLTVDIKSKLRVPLKYLNSILHTLAVVPSKLQSRICPEHWTHHLLREY